MKTLNERHLNGVEVYICKFSGFDPEATKRTLLRDPLTERELADFWKLVAEVKDQGIMKKNILKQYLKFNHESADFYEVFWRRFKLKKSRINKILTECRDDLIGLGLKKDISIALSLGDVSTSE